MHRSLFVLVVVFAASPCAPVSGQSLFIVQGERAVEGSVGWSVGPFSNGVETQVAVSVDGRWDIGFGFNRYSADFGGGDSIFTEWSPSVRYFLFKETDDGTPVSLAAHGALFQDNFAGDDQGWYVQAGGQLYKQFTMTDSLTLYPFVGFSLAGESSTFNGAEAERAVYLTRQFGVHGQISLGTDGWLRVTAEEQSFRRETYRAIRIAFLRRF